jgi:hypothetical protein
MCGFTVQRLSADPSCVNFGLSVNKSCFVLLAARSAAVLFIVSSRAGKWTFPDSVPSDACVLCPNARCFLPLSFLVLVPKRTTWMYVSELRGLGFVRFMKTISP